MCADNEHYIEKKFYKCNKLLNYISQKFIINCAKLRHPSLFLGHLEYWKNYSTYTDTLYYFSLSWRV